jgi:apolipoprotein D and lipocalin family protein
MAFVNLITAAAAQGISTVNEPVQKIDLHKYSGKWYVIGCIPMIFDRNWNYVIETYKPVGKMQVAIDTTYRTNGKLKAVRAKGFVCKDSGNARWKVQYLWPFKADYWIIELGEHYSYTVVGHPKHHFLYIMCRRPKMEEHIYAAIVERCGQKGYDLSKLKKILQEP